MILLNIQRDTLLKQLQLVIGIVERRHTLPILSNVFIGKSLNQLTLMATDLEIEVSTKIDCDDLNEAFSITVPAKKLQDICRALDDNASIGFHKDDSKILVKSGKSRFTLQTLPAADFPKISDLIDSKRSIVIPQKILKELFGQVQYAMALQNIRYYLNGLLLILETDTVKIVATDGHRLAMVSHKLSQLGDAQNAQEVILPRKTVLELVKLLGDNDEGVTIEIGQNQVRFAFSTILMVSKIIEGKFPDYNRAIPINYQNNLTMDRTVLLQTLQRAGILSTDKIGGVRLILTPNCLRVLCSNSEQEEAQEELEVAYDGVSLDIGFNIKYLLDVLTHFNDEKITCSFGDENSSVLITIPDKNNFKYVVMPMRI